MALVYGEQESSRVLRDALNDIGADLVCDADIASFDMGSLNESGADVVLISLDATLESRLDEVYGALDEERYRVMFDDPEISNNLDGWEHARWQRHLAAKLLDISDWDPPRPEQAASVQVPDAAASATSSESAGETGSEDDWMQDALAVLGGSETAAPVEATAPEDAEAREATADDASADEQRSEPAVDLPDASGSLALDDMPVSQSEARADTDAGSAAEADSRADGDAADAAQSLDLEAELDALAESDDPLAALSELARQDTAEHGPLDEAEAVEAVSIDLSDAEVDDDEDTLQALDALAENEAAAIDADKDEPIDSVPASRPDSSDDEQDWDALEAELNAAFDSETLGAIEQAAGQDAGDGVPDWERQAAEQGSEASADAAASESAAPSGPAEAPTAAPASTAGAGDDAAPATAGEPPAESSPLGLAELDDAVTPASSDSGKGAGEFEMPDFSGWALLDDEDGARDGDGDGDADALARAAPDADAQPSAASDMDFGLEDEPANEAQTSAADEEQAFSLELVDPIDYLKPDEPKDVSTELFSMPALMPMSEAIAPKVGDEEDAQSGTEAQSVLQRIVVLGASIGGPDAVREFISHLPQRLPALLVLVQHLGPEFVDLMVSQLAKVSALPVHIPTHGERAVHGEVLVVPGGRHLSMTREGHITFKDQGNEASNMPSINQVLSMVAQTFGSNAVAIVFSGMASDAVSGAVEMASSGGQVWVQDPDSCVVSKMVDEVVEAGVSRFAGDPKALAEKLVAYLKETD